MIKVIISLTAAVAILACGQACADDDIKSRSFPTNLEMLEDLARRIVDEKAVKIPVDSGEVILVRRTGDHAVSWIVENYLAGRLAALGAPVYLVREQPGEGLEESAAAGSDPEETAGNRRRPGAQDTTVVDPGGQEATAAWPDETDESDTWPPKSFKPEADDSLDVRAPGDDISLSEALTTPPGTAEAVESVKQSPSPFGDAPAPDLVLEFRVAELDVGYTRRWRKSLFGTAMVERTARAAIFFRLLDGKDGKVLWTDSGRSQRRDVVPQKLLAELEDTPGQTGPKSAGVGGIGRVVEPIVVSGIVVGLIFLFYSSRT